MLHELEMWVGGEFVNSPNLMYKGGKKHIFGGVDLDIFNLNDLYELYGRCGGRKTIVNFYYKLPGYSVEMVLRLLHNDSSDFAIGEMVRVYDEVDVPVAIYVEEVCDPLLVIDTQGNILPNIMTGGDKDAEMNLLMSGIDFTDDYERVATQQFRNEDNIQKETENARNEENIQMEVDKGKRKVTNMHIDEVDSEDSRSAFDDSSDADYTQPQWTDEEDTNDEPESDQNSLVYEDIEVSSDEDIFVEKNFSKRQMMMKLRKMLKQKSKKKNISHGTGAKDSLAKDNGWYSDLGEEDELQSLDGSDLEGDSHTPNHPYFKTGTKMKTFELVVGMKFQSSMVFREALRDYCVRHGYDLHFIRNENTRITAKCKHEGCNWRIHASPVQGGNIFQIKTLKGEHTCARSYVNNMAKAKYLGSRMEKVIRDNPHVPIQTLKHTILRKCNIDASKWKVIRAKRSALEQIHGVDCEQYTKLWDYCETVRVKNPGSKLLLRRKEGSDAPVFERMYFSLHAMKAGFLNGCRPIIGLDGCFLKTLYAGQLLVAVGRDGNDNMWPIALAVVPVENREMWTWFLTELLEDLGGTEQSYRWTFISDRQKGLLEAVKQLAPHSEHRFCLRHMYENFKQKFKSPALKELFWKAASTASKTDFQMYMKKIDEADPKLEQNIMNAAEWLKAIPPQHWTRSHFMTACKCDVLVNNLCESFNNYIIDARDKPIISMFEWIRTRLMTRIQQKREGMMRYNAAIADRRDKLENYVDQCYKKEVYLKTYEHMIHGVPGQRDYIKTTFEPLRPPHFKRKRGRPTKSRRKGPDELQNRTSTRKGLTQSCRKCLRVGHNKATCTNPPHQKSIFYKGTHTNEVPSSDFQDTHASRQRVVTMDAQPNVSQQSNSPQFTNTQSSQFSRKTMKQPIRGGKGTYQGPRNDALLGNKVGKNQKATVGPREANTTVTSSREANAAVIGPKQANATVTGPKQANSTTVNRRLKKPTVAEVLRNIRHRSLEKRAKQL